MALDFYAKCKRLRGDTHRERAARYRNLIEARLILYARRYARTAAAVDAEMNEKVLLDIMPRWAGRVVENPVLAKSRINA